MADHVVIGEKRIDFPFRREQLEELHAYELTTLMLQTRFCRPVKGMLIDYLMECDSKPRQRMLV